MSLLVTFVKVGGEDLLGILSRKHRGVYEVRRAAEKEVADNQGCQWEGGVASDCRRRVAMRLAGLWG